MGFKCCWIRLLALELLLSTKQVVNEDFPYQDQSGYYEYLVSGPKYSVSDEQLNASSQYNDLHAAKWGRLNTVYVKDEHIGGWAADNGSKVSHYIEVRLNELSCIKAVATQGRNITGDTQTNPQYVTRYQVYYKSDVDTKWVPVVSFGNAAKDFQGNNDSNSKQINGLPYDVNAIYVRILLKDWKIYPSMRFDVIGRPISQEEEKDTKTSRLSNGVAIFVGVLALSVLTAIGIFVARRTRTSAAATSNQPNQKLSLSVGHEIGPMGNEMFIDTIHDYANVISGKSKSDPAYLKHGNNQGVKSTNETRLINQGYEDTFFPNPKRITAQETQEEVIYDHLDSGERVPDIDMTYDHVKR